MTNREWLETLSDEQLARFFVKATRDCRCICYPFVRKTCGITLGDYTCTESIAMWFNAKHEED